jgi:hypothetical protein
VFSLLSETHFTGETTTSVFVVGIGVKREAGGGEDGSEI